MTHLKTCLRIKNGAQKVKMIRKLCLYVWTKRDCPIMIEASFGDGCKPLDAFESLTLRTGILDFNHVFPAKITARDLFVRLCNSCILRAKHRLA